MSPSPHDDESILFRETQHYGQHWLVALLTLIAFTGGALAILVVVSQENACPADDTSWTALGLPIAVAVGLPVAFVFMRLVTAVPATGLRVRLAPFQRHGRYVGWERLAGYRALTYRPIRDYGGWGIRGYGKRVAYNARGDRGVLLTMNDGSTLLVGSQAATRLEAAIAQVSGRAPDFSPDRPPSAG